jgi:hypothetical protein
MKELKFTKQTSVVALVFFTAYFFYGLFRLPFLQYLVSVAVGGIAYGITDSYEIAALALLIMNFLFPMLKGKEAFITNAGKEGFQATNAAEISQRVGSMKTGGLVTGVGSPMTEGFEDANAADHTLAENKIPSENSTSTTAASAPAPASSTPQAFASGPSNTAPAAPPTAPSTAPAPPAPSAISNQGVPPVHQPAARETFQDNGSLFKLGQIPQDAKGGFHIDAGTTVINALNALKPDQINAMTKDTKQLIETQKSLMNMLQTFSPMVNEGKQMMETFNSMFSPAMGSLQNAQTMLGAAK